MAKNYTFVDGNNLTAAQLNAITPDVPNAGDAIDTGWVALTLASGFSGTPYYRRIGIICYLKGTITRTAGVFTTTAETVTTLPAGARPTDATVRALTGLYATSTGATTLTTIATSGAINCSQWGSTSRDTVYLGSVPPFPVN